MIIQNLRIKGNNFIRLVFLFVLGFLLINFIAAFIYFGYPILQSRLKFVPKHSPVTQTYDLFDIGVTDANKDGYLDVFTLNHSARQNMLVSDSSGKWQDVLSQWRLDQDHGFANLEDRDTAPDVDEPGLYIYREDFDLQLYSYKSDPATPINGSLSLTLPVEATQQDNASVDIQTAPTGPGKTTVEFSLQPGGKITLKGFPEIPHEFKLDADIPLDSVYLGQERLHPQQHKFELMWRDRHSMAWADINQDNQLDVFIGRGGVRGKIGELPISLRDELFVRNQTDFRDEITSTQITKEGCPARQSAWVDFNGDGYLDLYINCGRAGDTEKNYPDLLYQQDQNGEFVNVAVQVGLNLPKVGYFIWLDVDSDGDQDLLASQEKQLALYVNEDGLFITEPIENEFQNNIVKITISDFDQDGDFDAYAITGKAGDNKLLINANGRYEVLSPNDIGLPASGEDATWVDYDNDGLIDLHVVALGIYRQTPKHTFKSTPILKDALPVFNTWSARSSWFDADTDGDRDLLLAYQQTPTLLQPTPSLKERVINQLQKHDTSKIWQSTLYRNRGSRYHWLVLDLVGDDLNPQAIGARTLVQASELNQAQQVGHSEGSRYSQGHYRLYFGLGQNSQADTIAIQWPDGTRQQLQNVKADQYLTIRKETDAA